MVAEWWCSVPLVRKVAGSNPIVVSTPKCESEMWIVRRQDFIMIQLDIQVHENQGEILSFCSLVQRASSQISSYSLYCNGIVLSAVQCSL